MRKVAIEGTDKLKREDVDGALRVRPHTIYDPTKAREGIAAARKLYSEKGHLDARIDLRTEPTRENEVDVTYDIDEGSPIRVAEIRIEGNHAFSDRKLRSPMQTKTAWILTPITGAGNLNRDVLRTDGERLTAWYYDNGYVTVRVDEPQVARQEDGLVVTVKIEEGPQFRVKTAGLRRRDALQVRTLVGARLALRDEQGHVPAGLRRGLRPLVGAEDHHPPRRGVDPHGRGPPRRRARQLRHAHAAGAARKGKHSAARRSRLPPSGSSTRTPPASVPQPGSSAP